MCFSEMNKRLNLKYSSASLIVSPSGIFDIDINRLVFGVLFVIHSQNIKPVEVLKTVYPRRR